MSIIEETISFSEEPSPDPKSWQTKMMKNSVYGVFGSSSGKSYILPAVLLNGLGDKKILYYDLESSLVDKIEAFAARLK